MYQLTHNTKFPNCICLLICKEALANCAILAHPRVGAEIVLCTDASDTAVGAALHQLQAGQIEPLAFFSRKLSATEAKYSAYDRELLAIYSAIKHFHTHLEARHFAVYTDHKPLVYTFTKKVENVPPRRQRQLNLISQYTADIRHVKGIENIPADTLSRVEAVTVPSAVPHEELAKTQEADEELRNLLQSTSTGLKLQRIPIPGTEVEIYCDVANGQSRPYIPREHRCTVFNIVHNLAHPGARTTAKMVTKRFVWPGIQKDCIMWARACTQCQKSKVSRHTRSPVGEFPSSNRFDHIHLDIVGPLPPAQGKRYIVTMIDRQSRWPEAVPTNDISAEAVSKIFLNTWVSRFGAPLRVTTDQGRQFEADLFNKLLGMFGTKRIRTTPYHPQANGRIERWHRTLKAAIMAYSKEDWVEILPLILLGLRCAVNEDSKVSSAQMAYGAELRLPGEFFTTTESRETLNAPTFVRQLASAMRKFSTQTKRHGDTPVYVPTTLKSAEYVFLRQQIQLKALEQPYKGPYKVLKRSDKHITIEQDGREATVSMDQLKPAFLLKEEEPTIITEPEPKAKRNPTRRVRFGGVYTN